MKHTSIEVLLVSVLYLYYKVVFKNTDTVYVEYTLQVFVSYILTARSLPAVANVEPSALKSRQFISFFRS